jgi:FAD/FMN-containing dehydrogenase
MRRPRLTGRVVRPGDREYDAARTNFNLRIDVRPRVIVFCRTARDVSNAVRWARAEGERISVRSGRHDYEGSSLGTGIVIDVSGLSDIQVDAANRLSAVGAGVALLPLYEALAEHGLALPGGSCATVGIAGLTLAGGFGMLSRALGLTCDNLLALDMIDASGAAVTASETQNPDLFWASRGGGGGTFGIVTSFTFRVHPIGVVTTYRASWPWDDLPEVLDAWQRFAPFADDRLTSVLRLPARGRAVESLGLFLGSKRELTPLLQPLTAGRAPRACVIEETTYLAAARAYAGVQPGAAASIARLLKLQSTRFKNTSDYARAPLRAAAVGTICDCLAAVPNAEAEVMLDAYGGAINRVPEDATAFPHREGTLYGLQYQTYWTNRAEDDTNLRWVEGFRARMAPFVSGEAYVGYASSAVVDWPRAYFGRGFSRLVAVKTKYDPEDVFQHAQSVPSASRPSPACPSRDR